jgi:hypothetical protein
VASGFVSDYADGHWGELGSGYWLHRSDQLHRCSVDERALNNDIYVPKAEAPQGRW